MCGPCGDVIVRSCFHIPAASISASALANVDLALSYMVGSFGSVRQDDAELEHAADPRHEVVGHCIEVEPRLPAPVAAGGRVVDRLGPAVEDRLAHRIGRI